MEPTQLVRQNLHFLEQGRTLVGGLSANDYASADETGRLHGAGPHLRHVLEHYGCFLEGLDAGRIDYESRRREALLESEPAAAGERIREIEAALGLLTPLAAASLEREIEIRVDCGDDDEAQWSRSTVKRELQFLASHTVHHYALIALLLAQRGVQVGPEFGVAPSTIRHWRSREAACAPLPG